MGRYTAAVGHWPPPRAGNRVNARPKRGSGLASPLNPIGKVPPLMGNTVQAAAEAATKSSGSSTFLILIVVFIGLIYFMAIRPGRNRQKKVSQQQKTVRPGARVRTTAGMYATVVAVDGDDVVLEVAPDIEVRELTRQLSAEMTLQSAIRHAAVAAQTRDAARAPQP